MDRCLCILSMLGTVLPLCGCAAFLTTLLPDTKQVTNSPWNSFDDAMASYEQIVPNRTTVSQLNQYGFDLANSPNVRNLNYVDIAVSAQSIEWSEMATGLQACIKAKERCRAYEFNPQVMHNKRRGNFWLDIFNFKRDTKKTGWNFKALFVIIDGTVVYKLWSGSRSIDQDEVVSNPMGPFQESAPGLIMRAIP